MSQTKNEVSYPLPPEPPEFPSNNTLIALQLTYDLPRRPEIISDLCNITDVFNYFKPHVEIELKSGNKNFQKQIFSFNSIESFEPKEIIAQSELLSDVRFTRDAYKKIESVLSSYNLLQHVLDNKQIFKSLLGCLKVLKEQLEIVKSKGVESSEFIANNETLRGELNGLAIVGGFDFLEVVVDGIQNLNPARKARRYIFLAEDERKPDRDLLTKTLEAWITILSKHKNIESSSKACLEKVKNAEALFKENLDHVFAVIKDLEASYRAVYLFYKNASGENITNVRIMNASIDQLKDLDNPIFKDAIFTEFCAQFDRLDLRNSYNLFVLPGFLGARNILTSWAKVAHKHKVMLLTDFVNVDDADDAIGLFQDTNLTGGEAWLSNVIMTCNWLQMQKTVDETGYVKEEVFISPAMVLAGKIYATSLAQPAAGKIFGKYIAVAEVAFNVRKAEWGEFQVSGIVPMIKEADEVLSFGCATLFTGDNIAMRYYNTVRLLDWLSKRLIQLLNERVYADWGVVHSATEREIGKFLESITGPFKYIDAFIIKLFENDPDDKSKVNLDIDIQTFFPAKTFGLKLEWINPDGYDSVGWSSKYVQY